MTGDVGRPRADIDWGQLDIALRYGATISECAGLFNVHPATLTRFIRREMQMSFEEYRQHLYGGTKIKLREVMWKKAIEADDSNMQMWLSKNQLEGFDGSAKQEPVDAVEIDKQIADRKEEIAYLASILIKLGIFKDGQSGPVSAAQSGTLSAEAGGIVPSGEQAVSVLPPGVVYLRASNET